MSLDWQNIHHLLLCWLDETADVQVLTTLLHLLNQTAPHIRITLLVQSANIQSSHVQVVVCHQSSEFNQILETLSSNTFDAAMILTAPAQSPYSIAYLCYLAAIPIRVGQSQEFGGGVLSHCIPPLVEPVESIDYHLHLLQSFGILIPQQSTQNLKSRISYAVTNSNLAYSR